MTPRNAFHPARPLAALILSMATATAAWAQAHSQDFGAYTLQSSTVNSQNLAEEAAQRYGIQRGPSTAVLNVTVLHGGEQGASRTVPARVQVQVVDMAGVSNPVQMREIRAGGRVSYMGTYTILPRQVFDFTITALPQGGSEPLTMSYRERMWADMGTN